MQLKAYVQLRIESYELLQKALEEQTSQYDSRLEAKNAEIESILKTLNEAK